MRSPRTGEKICRVYVFFCIYFCLFVTSARGETECHDTQQSLTTSSVVIRFPVKPKESVFPVPSIWLKPIDSSLTKTKSITLSFGKEDDSGVFSSDFELQFRLGKKYLQYTCKGVKDKNQYIDSRVRREWMSNQKWTRFTLGESKFTLQFGKEDQVLDIQLQGFEIGAVEAVKLSGTLEVTASTNCDVPEDEAITTTIITTIPPTTTVGTTATPVLTTTVPEETTTTEDFETTTLEEADDYTTDAETLDIVPVAVREDLDEQDCTSIPPWVWICIGAMVVFAILSIVLLVYVILLKRHKQSHGVSSMLQEHILPGRLNSPSGYGQQAQDLHYLKPEGKKESSISVNPKPSFESYTQTLQLPTGNQLAPDVHFYTAPRSSVYRRSTSCPGPREPSPSLHFPAPPSTPPPEARPETVPLFCPNGSVDNGHSRKRSYSKGRHSERSSSRRKNRSREGADADDESSLSN